MFEILIPNRKFRVSPQSFSIPDYTTSNGDPLSVSGVIYDGTPHLHVISLVRAISNTPASVEPSAISVVRKILAKARFGQGRVIFTPRGSIFADPMALCSILSVMFLDSQSVEKELLNTAIPTRGAGAGVRPKFRTVIDADLYEAVMLSSDKLCNSCSSAQNQINPLWFDVSSPSDWNKAPAKKPEVVNDIPDDDSQQSEAAVTVNAAEAGTSPVLDIGLSALASMSNPAEPQQQSALLELVKLLASGKKLTIQVSLD